MGKKQYGGRTVKNFVSDISEKRKNQKQWHNLTPMKWWKKTNATMNVAFYLKQDLYVTMEVDVRGLTPCGWSQSIERKASWNPRDSVTPDVDS